MGGIDRRYFDLSLVDLWGGGRRNGESSGWWDGAVGFIGGLVGTHWFLHDTQGDASRVRLLSEPSTAGSTALPVLWRGDPSARK